VPLGADAAVAVVSADAARSQLVIQAPQDKPGAFCERKCSV
jgi:hypothetical protein